MTIAEACRRYGLHRTQVHRWIRDGRLGALAVGGCYRPKAYLIDPNEVAALAAELDTLRRLGVTRAATRHMKERAPR